MTSVPPSDTPLTERLTAEEIHALATLLVGLARSYKEHLERHGITIEQLRAEQRAAKRKGRRVLHNEAES
jgi:hypothetical protein